MPMFSLISSLFHYRSRGHPDSNQQNNNHHYHHHPHTHRRYSFTGGRKQRDYVCYCPSCGDDVVNISSSRTQFQRPLHHQQHDTNEEQAQQQQHHHHHHHHQQQQERQPKGAAISSSSSSARPAWDDRDGHYIVTPGTNFADRYHIIKLLGQGTFGKVIKCLDYRTNKLVAVKVIRAVQKYRDAAQIEMRVLETLKRHDPTNKFQCIHMNESFDYRNHVCMTFDLLGPSIYDFLKGNEFRPFSLAHVQCIGQQLLNSVAYVHSMRLVHTDLKPENILLCNGDYTMMPFAPNPAVQTKILKSTKICLIDFGSATFEDEYHSHVVSTRHYRAPEIILGLGWSYPCDMWSIGCILIELLTGTALFHTREDLEHLAMMERVIGETPQSIRVRLDPSTYYKFYHQSGKLRYPNSKTTPKSRHDVSAVRALRDIVPPHNNIIYRELYSLLEGLLRFDPSERLTADQAKDHPFFRNIIGQHGKLVPRDQAATPVPAKPSVVQKPPAAVPSTVAFRAAPSPKQQPARMIDVAAVGSNHVHMPNTAVTVVAGSGGGGGGGCYRQAVETGPIPVSLSALASRADVVGAAIVSSSSSLSLSALESKVTAGNSAIYDGLYNQHSKHKDSGFAMEPGDPLLSLAEAVAARTRPKSPVADIPNLAKSQQQNYPPSTAMVPTSSTHQGLSLMPIQHQQQQQQQLRNPWASSDAHSQVQFPVSPAPVFSGYNSKKYHPLNPTTTTTATTAIGGHGGLLADRRQQQPLGHSQHPAISSWSSLPHGAQAVPIHQQYHHHHLGKKLSAMASSPTTLLSGNEAAVTAIPNLYAVAGQKPSHQPPPPQSMVFSPIITGSASTGRFQSQNLSGPSTPNLTLNADSSSISSINGIGSGGNYCDGDSSGCSSTSSCNACGVAGNLCQQQYGEDGGCDQSITNGLARQQQQQQQQRQQGKQDLTHHPDLSVFSKSSHSNGNQASRLEVAASDSNARCIRLQDQHHYQPPPPSSSSTSGSSAVNDAPVVYHSYQHSLGVFMPTTMPSTSSSGPPYLTAASTTGFGSSQHVAVGPATGGYPINTRVVGGSGSVNLSYHIAN